MRRFYFHYWDGDVLTKDSEGSEHDDAHGAYLEAFDTVETLAIDLIRDHRSAMQGRIEVVDGLGRCVFDLPFAEVVDRGGLARQVRGLYRYQTAPWRWWACTEGPNRERVNIQRQRYEDAGIQPPFFELPIRANSNDGKSKKAA
jgi:hypothetical protein